MTYTTNEQFKTNEQLSQLNDRKLNDTRLRGKSVGVIWIGGVGHFVVIDRSLLVFDTISWMKCLADKSEERALEYEAEGDQEMAQDEREEADEYRAWLADHSKMITMRPDIGRRLAIDNFEQVKASDLQAYLRHTVIQPIQNAFSRVTCMEEKEAVVQKLLIQEHDEPDFILMADHNPPTLYATDVNMDALQHTGHTILGVKTSSEDVVGRYVDLSNLFMEQILAVEQNRELEQSLAQQNMAQFDPSLARVPIRDTSGIHPKEKAAGQEVQSSRRNPMITDSSIVILKR